MNARSAPKAARNADPYGRGSEPGADAPTGEPQTGPQVLPRSAVDKLSRHHTDQDRRAEEDRLRDEDLLHDQQQRQPHRPADAAPAQRLAEYDRYDGQDHKPVHIVGIPCPGM